MLSFNNIKKINVMLFEEHSFGYIFVPEYLISVYAL